MFYLVYVSAAVTWFSEAELRGLMAGARVANQHAGITGMLLYKDGNFMQALEGDEKVVRGLFSRISRDLRHRGVVLIDSGHLAQRQFAAWSMGFVDLGRDADHPAGYSRFLETPLTDPSFTQVPGPCRELLQLFCQLD